MKFNPKNPNWVNRDRFVLSYVPYLTPFSNSTRLKWCVTDSRSNGHGCMLQYALLHLFGYDLTLDDLKAFRVG